MSGVEPLLVPIGVWAWESYGKDAVAWIVKLLAKRAKDVKVAGWERVDWALASRAYRQEMRRLYGSMQIFGMSRPVPLTGIFTDTYLLDRPSAWRRYAIEELRAHGQVQPDRISTERRHNGVGLVQSESRLFILGQPGAGKTTFLKYLVAQAITGKLDAIPIFVSLKAWSDTNIELLPFLVRQFAICGFPDAWPFVERILEEGKALVLFDGLDEVNLEAGARQRITTALRECAQQYGESRMVVTCRTAATEYMFERFSYCELADFTQEQIEAFAVRWFQDDGTKRAAFLKALAHEDNKWLRDLSSRPLLLTMLCLTFEETMAFPRRRGELYEEAIDALLKKWDNARSIQRDAIYRKLSLGYKRQLLVELAAETFERGEFFMPKRDVVERTTRFLRRLPPADITEDIDGEAVLRAIEAQHGLLVERAFGIYSFSHLTFHEYFAARYIVDHPENKVLRAVVVHGADPQWREVLLLIASMLDYRNIESLFRIWSHTLQEEVQGNTGLLSLITFSVKTSQAIVPPSSVMRASVLIVALLDQASVIVKQMIPVLERACIRIRALNVDLASELARNLTNARALKLVLDLAFTHDLASTLDRVRIIAGVSIRDLNLLSCVDVDIYNSPLDFALVHELASDLNHTRASVASPLDFAFAHKIASDLDRTHASVVSHTKVHDIDPDPVLYLALERASTSTRACATILNCASMLLRVRDLCVRCHTSFIPRSYIPERGREWQLTLEQLDKLYEYVSSTYRLLECLDVAAVEDRTAVLDQVLTVSGSSKVA